MDDEADPSGFMVTNNFSKKVKARPVRGSSGDLGSRIGSGDVDTIADEQQKRKLKKLLRDTTVVLHSLEASVGDHEVKSIDVDALKQAVVYLEMAVAKGGEDS